MGADGASSAVLMFCGNDSWMTAGITDAGFGLRLRLECRPERLRVRGETPARRPERFSRICPNTSPHPLQRNSENTRLILQTRHNLLNIIQCCSLMNTSDIISKHSESQADCPLCWKWSIWFQNSAEPLLYELYLIYTNVSRISDSCSRVKSHTTCSLPSLNRVLETCLNLLSQSPT